jgi:RNA polymerase sigma-70 factor (ECF subfamily)
VGAALARIPSGGVVGRPPAGRRRLVRVGVAVAAVAAVLATGIAVTGLRSGDSVPIGATAAAAEVLDRAAAAAAKAAPAPVPGPGQVLYRRETGGQPVGTMGGGRDQAHLCASVHETWLPADPAVHAAIRRTDGIVVRSGTGDPTAMPRDPACSYDSFSDDIGPVPNGQLGGPDLRTLSTDPRTLYRQAREQGKDGGDNPDEGTFMALLDLARSASPYRSPRMTAAIYRALAYVPGVQLVGPGRDLLGRPGVVVGRTEPDRGSREEVIFDPSTGLMLGRRETVTDPGRVAELPIRGAVLWQSVITSAVVDRVGQRPSP